MDRRRLEAEAEAAEEARATEGPYQTPTTLDEVREWVSDTSSEGQGRSAYLLLLNVTHSNLRATHIQQLRVDGRSTVLDLKDKLYRHVGTRPASMRLLHSGIELSSGSMTLFSAGVCTGDTVHVVDEDPHSASAGGWLEDTSLVPKYELSADAYAAKKGTYRQFRDKMRQTDPTWTMTGAIRRKQQETQNDSLPSDVSVGKRCSVTPGGKRGEIVFVGEELKDLPKGWWVGVCYDEPVGKNDGSIKGVRYFSVPDKFGGLVRPSNVAVGDFPPLQIDEDDDVEEQDEDEEI